MKKVVALKISSLILVVFLRLVLWLPVMFLEVKMKALRSKA